MSPSDCCPFSYLFSSTKYQVPPDYQRVPRLVPRRGRLRTSAALPAPGGSYTLPWIGTRPNQPPHAAQFNLVQDDNCVWGGAFTTPDSEEGGRKEWMGWINWSALDDEA